MKINDTLARYMELALLLHWDDTLTYDATDLLLEAMDPLWFQLTEEQIEFLDRPLIENS